MSNKPDNDLTTSVNEMYRLIGMQIRKLRKQTNITSTELGEKIGVSQQQISRYENGSTKISLEIILRLSQVFGVSPYYFVDDGLLFFTRAHLPEDHAWPAGHFRGRKSADEDDETPAGR